MMSVPASDEPSATPPTAPRALLGARARVAPVVALDEPVGAVHRAGDLSGAPCRGSFARPPTPLLGRCAHAHLAPPAILCEAIRAFLEATVVGAVYVLRGGSRAARAAGRAGPPLSGLAAAGHAVVGAHDVLLAAWARRGALDGGAVGVEGHAGADGAVVLGHKAVGAALATGASGGRAAGIV